MHSISASLTIKLILIGCGAFAVIRQCFYNTNNMRDIFENVDVDILSFLKEIKLYQKYNKLKLYPIDLSLKAIFQSI